MKPKPRIISSAVVKNGNRFLLVKELMEDSKEWWVFPGGGVEFGETIEDAARREIKEEVGLDIKIKDFLGFKEAIYTKHDYHTVIFFFLAEPLNDKLLKNGVLDVGYFTIEEMKKLNLVDSAKWVLEQMNKNPIV